MLDKKLLINDYDIKIKNIKKDLNIKLISDIHFCNTFDINKLEIIKRFLFSSKTDYLFVAGDIIDSTNFIYDNPKLLDIIINWFTLIAKKIPIYIVKGNHDVLFKKDNKPIIYNNNLFINRLKEIENIYFKVETSTIENEDLKVLIINPSIMHYKANNDESYLIKELKKYDTNENQNNKLKIILNHSPIYMDDEKILNYTQDYDLVLSGHMHNGAIPFNLNRILPGNWGFISPHKKLFPKLARGMKKIQTPLKMQYLIISGGITKIHSSYNKYLNCIYSMEIENINIKKL